MSRSSSRSAPSRKPAPTELTGGPRKVVSCPRCGAPVPWDQSSPYRPFCSERCKMNDLGAWATESYRIPVEEDNDTPEDSEQ
jgi:endogenous inhibitor of DNA gyrase (YacG/DUF329 family)